MGEIKPSSRAKTNFWITATEMRGGGKKSAGNDYVIENSQSYALPSEVQQQLVRLIGEGYWVSVFVMAQRDKRKVIPGEQCKQLTW